MSRACFETSNKFRVIGTRGKVMKGSIERNKVGEVGQVRI